MPAAVELSLVGALALPVVAAFIAHGGLFPRGQAAFAVVSVAATLGVVALGGWSGAALRTPAMLALVGLAALSALSAAWTISSPTAALRWAAVIAALVLVALSASIVAQRVGAARIAAVVAVLAAAAGLVGLYGAGARVEPLAQRLGGQWSAGGPLEYSPALALIEVASLPILTAAMARGRDWVAGVAAAGAGVAGAVLALAGSRVELAIGIGVVVVCTIAARRLMGIGAPIIVAAVGLAVTAGGLADAVAGSYVRPYAVGGDAPRLAGLAAIVIGAPALWLFQRRVMRTGSSGSRRRRALAIAAVSVPVAGALAAAALTPDSGPQAEPVSGFAHGRPALWEAAVDAAADRPLAGAGSLSFYDASLPYQDPPAVRFAHNLPLESWVELGLSGALLAVILYVGTAALVWSRRGTAAAWLLGPGALAFLFANLFDWPWHLPAAGAVFALCLGGLAGTPRTTAESNGGPSGR
jgi:O-antigen ligase